LAHYAFYEFFAGGGMARAGLGAGWRCLFANDIDPMKARTYAANWGGEDLRLCDVAHLGVEDLPGQAHLAWASFPCQDLSLAGDGRGLGSDAGAERTRSGMFWPFWRLMSALGQDGRAPRIIVLENVMGILSANSGRDFTAVVQALGGAGYRTGALVHDARWFLPQSRPRVFILAVAAETEVPAALTLEAPSGPFLTEALIAAHGRLPARAKAAWIWWRLAPPTTSPPPLGAFIDLEDDDAPGAPRGRWLDDDALAALFDSMTPLNRAKVEAARRSGSRRIGALYKRTRKDAEGRRIVRAEVRFDDLAGCIRTPAGGSSRQRILIVEGERVRSRLLTGREAARLMGLAETYQLPRGYTDAYHLAGDGVAVPVVRHLARALLEPLAAAKTVSSLTQAAAE